MKLFVFEIGTIMMLGGTILFGGGAWLILLECAAVYWLGDIRARYQKSGDRY